MSNNSIRKLYDLLFGDDDEPNNNTENWWDKLSDDPIEKLDKSHQYPISQFEAYLIANKDNNLKSDFCKNTDKSISYIGFTNCKVDLITKDNNLYWYVQITDGDVSWISFEKNNWKRKSEPTFCDGSFSEKELEKLQCLIDVNTGNYQYFPKYNR